MQNLSANHAGSSGPSLMTVNKIRGLDVFNHLNQPLGKIQDYILNVLDLSFDYVVMSFDAMSGIKHTMFIVPWQALTLDEKNKRFILPFYKYQLRSAPGFNTGWPDPPTPSLLREIDAFYKVL